MTAVILEDDPDGLLRFDGSSLPGLRELSGDAPNDSGEGTTEGVRRLRGALERVYGERWL